VSSLSMPIRQVAEWKQKLVEARRDSTFYTASYVDAGRAFLLRMAGKLRSEEPGRPVFVGSGCDWLLDSGATIIVRASRGEPAPPGEANNPFFPEASTIGGAGYWRYLDHPTGRNTRVRLKVGAMLALHADTFICRGAYLSVWEHKTLEIESSVYVGNDVLITTSLGLTVGAGTMIGLGTIIMDYDGHPIDMAAGGPPALVAAEHQSPNSGGTKAPIEIGKRVWIGFHSTILKGVRIGDGAIIGARSVVTRDVPAHAVVAGNPAQIVREGATWRP
jgi:acetyltransferase-like isoleucine patch superfamily enzyme